MGRRRRRRPRAVEAVDALRAAGKGVAFVTNDARHAEDYVVRKLWRLGFRASLEEVVTVGGGAAVRARLDAGLAARRSSIGSGAIHRHVEDAGVRDPQRPDLAARADVVVVAGHDDFDYDELRDAIAGGPRGAELICAGARRDVPDA